MRQNRFLATTLAGALLLSLILSGCGTKETAPAPAQLVKTTQVGAKGGDMEGTYSGTVKGRYESNLAFQTGGRITARNVQLGSQVRQGDVLMSINPQDVNQAVNQAQAQANAAQAQLELAKSNLARYQALYQQDAVSAAALDQYQTAYDQANAQYNQAMAAVQAQQNQLSYTSLTADADGVIAAVNAEVGQVVGAGTPVLTLVHNGDLEVQINVPENHVQDFPIGKEVTVNFWALQNQDATGTVREVSPMADPASRTYKVSIALANPPQGMQLGMTASVINTSPNATKDSTFVLPLSAIYQTGDKPQVWVVGKDKTLSLKTVTVTDFGNDTVQVGGLTAGDIVVTAGVQLLHEGEKVRTEGDEA